MELFSAKLSLFVLFFFLFLLLLFLAEGNIDSVTGGLLCCLPIGTMLCLRSCETEILVRRIADCPWPLVSLEAGALDEAPWWLIFVNALLIQWIFDVYSVFSIGFKRYNFVTERRWVDTRFAHHITYLTFLFELKLTWELFVQTSIQFKVTHSPHFLKLRLLVGLGGSCLVIIDRVEV